MWMKEGKSASDDLDGGQKEGFSYKDYSNIHEKITLVWLPENECTFHATRVQSCNSSANCK